METQLVSEQKYFRGHRVLVADGPDAIVVGSYHDQYGCGNFKDYTLVILNDEDEPITRISWYHESRLRLINDDRVEGWHILDRYDAKRRSDSATGSDT